MEFSLFFQMIIKAIGGLGIFLLGMKYMSEGMQSIAGINYAALLIKSPTIDLWPQASAPL